MVRVSLDQVFSEELMAEFEKETGLSVKAQYDIEQTKTVGHVRAIIEEKTRPRTDVFWNNEIAQTIRLAELGLLAPYDSPSAEGIPESFRDPERRWTGFAARARVLRSRFLGQNSLVDFKLEQGAVLTASVPSVFLPKPDTLFWLLAPRKNCYVFPRSA